MFEQLRTDVRYSVRWLLRSPGFALVAVASLAIGRRFRLRSVDGPEYEVIGAMRREVLALEPNAVFLDSQTMNAQVDMALMPARLAAQAASLVGVVATVLAAIGLYGVIAYAVARRTREIGIRMALGAARGNVVSLVMKQGLTVALTGIAVGSVMALLAARAIAGHSMA